MTESAQALAELVCLIEELEADEASAEMVRSSVAGLRSSGVAISFDAVLSYLGPSWRGASIFATLIVREDNRQHIAEVLAAVPIGTAH